MTGGPNTHRLSDGRSEPSWRLEHRGWGEVRAGKAFAGILARLVPIGEQGSDVHALITEAHCSQDFRAACERGHDAQRALTAARKDVVASRARLDVARRAAGEQMTVMPALGGLFLRPRSQQARTRRRASRGVERWRPVMTDQQALALARLIRGRTNSNVNIVRAPFDLPTGYLLVTFVVGGFTCGIAPDGSVSS
jgi:hypothetical protein